MAELLEFSFEIQAFTPETMPFDRLMDYLRDVAVLFGEPSEFHLVDIREGSTKPVFAMRPDVAVRVRERVAEVRSGGGPKPSRSAYERIDRRVREDGGTALIRAPEGATILSFVGADSSAGLMHGVRQPTTIEGMLVRIGGVREFSTLLIQGEDGKLIAGCSATHAVAKQLAHLLYEQVRLSGVGTWARSAEGEWMLDRMQVQTYEKLDERAHMDVIRELQALSVAWPDDAAKQLAALRAGAH